MKIKIGKTEEEIKILSKTWTEVFLWFPIIGDGYFYWLCKMERKLFVFNIGSIWTYRSIKDSDE